MSSFHWVCPLLLFFYNSAWVEREGFAADVKMSSDLVRALVSMGCLEMVNKF